MGKGIKSSKGVKCPGKRGYCDCSASACATSPNCACFEAALDPCCGDGTLTNAEVVFQRALDEGNVVFCPQNPLIEFCDCQSSGDCADIGTTKPSKDFCKCAEAYEADCCNLGPFVSTSLLDEETIVVCPGKDPDEEFCDCDGDCEEGDFCDCDEAKGRGCCNEK